MHDDLGSVGRVKRLAELVDGEAHREIVAGAMSESFRARSGDSTGSKVRSV
jgi:hypothetical protein